MESKMLESSERAVFGFGIRSFSFNKSKKTKSIDDSKKKQKDIVFTPFHLYYCNTQEDYLRISDHFE